MSVLRFITGAKKKIMSYVEMRKRQRISQIKTLAPKFTRETLIIELDKTLKLETWLILTAKERESILALAKPNGE